MSTIKFIVRAEMISPAPVYVRLSVGRKQVFITKTRMQVEPERWCNKQQGIKLRKLSDNDKKLMRRLSELKEHIDSENRFYGGVRSRAWLDSVITRFYSAGSDAQTMNGFIADFLEKAGSGELKTKAGVNYAVGTLKSLKGFQTIFSEYQGIYTDDRYAELMKAKKTPRKRINIDFADITIDFYNSFLSYMSSEGFAINTMGKHIGSLKFFMRRGLALRLHSNREFLESAFAEVSEDSHAIYLTPAEIEKIYRHDLSSDKRQEKARDAFIVLCETALRVSDYRQLEYSITTRAGKKYIDLYQTKTADRVVIPLTARLEDIILKYGGKLPLTHDVYINRYIKTVAFACKITEPITWTAQKFGKRFPKTEQKWKLITCHTARRSAATNLIRAGVPVALVMRLTGHKTEKTFWKYIRITEEQVAEELSRLPAFSNLRVV